MVEDKPLDEAIEQFENADNISVNRQLCPNKVLVKVEEPEAIGNFFKISRETGVERNSTTRNDLHYTVLDSWVSNPDS